MITVIFFFNDTATTEIYTLSLHDALPILVHRRRPRRLCGAARPWRAGPPGGGRPGHRLVRPGRHGREQSRHSAGRSEEYTSELQSRQYLVCRLLLEKKKRGTRSEEQSYST